MSLIPIRKKIFFIDNGCHSACHLRNTGAEDSTVSHSIWDDETFDVSAFALDNSVVKGVMASLHATHVLCLCQQQGCIESWYYME